MQAWPSASTWLVEHIIAAAEGDPGRRTSGKGRFCSFSFRHLRLIFSFSDEPAGWLSPCLPWSRLQSWPSNQVKDTSWKIDRFFMGRFDIPRNPCKGSCMSHIFSHWLQFFLSTQNTLGSLRTERTRQIGYSWHWCSVLIYFHLAGDLFCGFWAKPQTCRTSAGSRGKLRHLRNQGSQ